MAGYLFDQAAAKKELKAFFKKEKASINSFGNKVNQTFEAKVLASVIKYYRNNGWAVRIVNPIKYGRHVFSLKFNTRGAPVKYSYAICTKGGESCQIRHGLRTHTKSYKITNNKSANIVCDIVIMNNINIDHFASATALPNQQLIAFGEVKHMSAFAELIANFMGMVFELKPESLRRIRTRKWVKTQHISSFLYVSGMLWGTAEGLVETINQRKFDIDIFSFSHPIP